MKLNNIIFTSFVLLGALALPGAVSAETVTGKIIGHHCAHEGKSCPIDKMDPHVALEWDFVLQKGNGDYYFLTNVPRDVKVRHVLETVTVSGKLNSRYHSIDVDSIKSGNKVAWSKEQHEQCLAELYSGAGYTSSGCF